MRRSSLSTLLATILVLVPAMAYAAHGKAGLWTVTSTMDLPNMPPVPPNVQAMMKARHVAIPNSGQPFVTQMCMTEEEVNADKPPPINNGNEHCDTKVLNQSPAIMEAEITCHGRVDGVGHVKVNWSSNEHYEGMYNFKGAMQGHPQDMITHFSGDFVKSDCGSVRPAMPPRPMQ